ncbi:uncharacterized protein ARMOST_07961 [Armillaria ostoyae]|uniref:F-box domain-containing protein n=1 Tax=Armillaria ostoyae TaxID=47428 RepID=A0A284R7A9_ARMOS|nr:uncharacterized protein ARMOST_07961 [Armillaria ostoyae]
MHSLAFQGEPHSDPSSTGLPGLPNELLLAISSDLDHNDITSLASVSCWLNKIAVCSHLDSLRHVSANNGVILQCLTNEQLEDKKCQPFSSLHILRMSIHSVPQIPQMRHFTLCFSSRFSREFAEVKRYLDTTSHTPGLRVDFRGISFEPQGLETPDDVLQSFEALCTGLTTFKCHALTLSYQKNIFKNLLSVTKVPFNPPPLTTLYGAAIPPQAERMTDWVIRSLSQSPLQLLITDGAAKPMLSQLNLPCLTHFTCMYLCGDIGIKVDTLLFLLHHPMMEHIRLGASSVSTLDRNVVACILQKQTFPNLCSLAAGIEVLDILLANPSSFPAIKEVSVHGPILSPESLSPHLLGTPHEWYTLLSSVLILIASMLAIESLKLPFLSDFNCAAWNAFSVPSSWGLTYRPESLLAGIRRLVLYAAPGTPSQQVADTLITALQRFPALRYVQIDDPYFLENIGMSGKGPKWAKKLHCVLPNLSEIEINQIKQL